MIPLIGVWNSDNIGGSTKKAVAIGLQVGWGNLGGIIASFTFLTKDSPRYVFSFHIPLMQSLGHDSHPSCHYSSLQCSLPSQHPLYIEHHHPSASAISSTTITPHQTPYNPPRTLLHHQYPTSPTPSSTIYKLTTPPQIYHRPRNPHRPPLHGLDPLPLHDNLLPPRKRTPKGTRGFRNLPRARAPSTGGRVG